MRIAEPDHVLAAIDQAEHAYWIFHEQTKLGVRSEQFKPTLETTDQERESVVLGSANLDGSVVPIAAFSPGMLGGLAEAIRGRRSATAVPQAQLSLARTARWLTGAYYVSGTHQAAHGMVALRTSPSAGALYPINIYLASAQVDGLPCGVYYYDPGRRVLITVRQGEQIGHKLMAASHGQALAEWPVGAVLLTARFPRTVNKYGERGYRYCLLEAGHIAQNLCLVGTALNIAVHCRGAFYDDLVNALIGIDGRTESVVYMLFFGAGPDASGAHRPEQGGRES